MKHTIQTLFSLVLLSIATLSAQKRLCFNIENRFKIVQFTDLHTIASDPRSEAVFQNFRAIISTEKPDLILLTGDLVYKAPGKKTLGIVLDSLSQYEKPFAITFGNHDREFGATNAELFEVAQSYPNFVGSSTPNVAGVGNTDLLIYDSKGKQPLLVLYLIDSHQISPLRGEASHYDYIKPSQVSWYRAQSQQHRKQNNGKPLPALAFFHIPLPEYEMALIDQQQPIYGIQQEKPCTPHLNSGLFTAFLEQGDVKGVFTGHDHDNDYATLYYGILLAYGRFSGGKTEYFNLDTPGARIIELFATGDRLFDTWIRLSNGTLLQRLSIRRE